MVSEWALLIDRGLDAAGGFLLLGDHAEVICDGDSSILTYVKKQTASMTAVDCYNLLRAARESNCQRIVGITDSYTYKIGWETAAYKFTWGGDVSASKDEGAEALPWMYDHLCRVAARKSVSSTGDYVWDPTHRHCFDSTWREIL